MSTLYNIPESFCMSISCGICCKRTVKGSWRLAALNFFFNMHECATKRFFKSKVFSIANCIVEKKEEKKYKRTKIHKIIKSQSKTPHPPHFYHKAPETCNTVTQ